MGVKKIAIILRSSDLTPELRATLEKRKDLISSQQKQAKMKDQSKQYHITEGRKFSTVDVPNHLEQQWLQANKERALAGEGMPDRDAYDQFMAKHTEGGKSEL